MKAKKILLFILSIIFIVFISSQLYYNCTYKGNLIFFVTNESLMDSVHLEIYIDGNKVLDEKLSNEGVSLRKPYSIKTTLSNHTAMIKINGEVSKKIEFNTFLVTFIDVEYYGDRFDIVSDGYSEHFIISIQKHSIFFIS